MSIQTFRHRDSEILKSMPNPGGAIEMMIDVPELTFLGDRSQPDFGSFRIWFYPDDLVIELKSLKQYVYQYRNLLVSYERIANCIYDDLLSRFAPARLRLEFAFRPRGGISSRIVIDSDWAVRGGSDKLWSTERREILNYT